VGSLTSLPTFHLEPRLWRRAALGVGALAFLELVALVALVALLVARAATQDGVAKPAEARHAARSAVALRRHPVVKLPAAVVPIQPRDHLRILVLNGNGKTGAAASAAGQLRRLGYLIAGTANATHQNYAASLVMYRPGFRAAALRLAHDLGVHIVGPLDGMRAAALDGGQLAVILGA
jgi:hypothetical protein